MELENHTPFPAMIYRGGIDDHRLFGSVFVRVTYDIVGDSLVPAAEQTWVVSPPPWESDYGPMDSDEVFYRGGVDFFVFGSARSPGGAPAAQLTLDAKVGDSFHRQLAVFGPRHWQKQGDDLVPSKPEPIAEMPLTLANAFGGKDVWDELEIPYPDNPDGKGFYLEEDNAEGQPLPHIEDPDNLISRWDDRPDPVGTQATLMTFGPRVRGSVTFNEESGFLKELKPTFFNSAFPDMVVPKAFPGDRVEIGGVRSEGPLNFTLPKSDLTVRLRFGDKTTNHEPTIDQIGVEPDRMRAFVAYRYPFRYVLTPLQKRECHLDALNGDERH